MLRVTTIHVSAAASSARYYTRYLADEDGPEGQGVWLGRQATESGITGLVSAAHLEALLSGHDPMTGTRLGNPLVDRFDTEGRVIPAVAGFDATFSAPKSVSVWWHSPAIRVCSTRTTPQCAPCSSTWSATGPLPESG
jgi:hypothetical protein